MWMLLISPILALLPKQWRNSLRFSAPFPWVPATILSGFVESFVAAMALVYWYSRFVLAWGDRIVDAATRGNAAAQSVPGQTLGFAALMLWTLHPLTWLIAFFAIEGIVRMFDAIASGQILGTFPLYLVDRVIGKIGGRPVTSETGPSIGPIAAVSSIARAAHEHARLAVTEKLADEWLSKTEGNEEVIEIRCQTPKQDWDPPRVVRIHEAYYRLESAERHDFPRPYLYRLRKLSAGVPGRRVLIYEPASTESESKD